MEPKLQIITLVKIVCPECRSERLSQTVGNTNAVKQIRQSDGVVSDETAESAATAGISGQTIPNPNFFLRGYSCYNCNIEISKI